MYRRTDIQFYPICTECPIVYYSVEWRLILNTSLTTSIYGHTVKAQCCCEQSSCDSSLQREKARIWKALNAVQNQTPFYAVGRSFAAYGSSYAAGSCTCVQCSLIRDSAPLINTVIIGGCLLMLITCYLLGVDTQTPAQSGDDPDKADQDYEEDGKNEILSQRNYRYAVVCNVRPLCFHLYNMYTYNMYMNNHVHRAPFSDIHVYI